MDGGEGPEGRGALHFLLPATDRRADFALERHRAATGATHVSREHFAEGVRRFVGGLAKKMMIANAVAVPADQIFALPAKN